MPQSEEEKTSPDASQSSNPFADRSLPDALLWEEGFGGHHSPSFPIVGIGASAGGVEALEHLFKSLPPSS